MPRTITRWLILQKARHHGHDRSHDDALTDCMPTVSGLFHSPPGVLFTFPSRYWFTIGRLRILSLTRWSSRIHASFHGPGVTWESRAEADYVSCTGLLPTAARFSKALPLRINLVTPCRIWCACSHFPQPLTGNATRLDTNQVWADPVSLAATQGVTFVLLSSGY